MIVGVFSTHFYFVFVLVLVLRIVEIHVNLGIFRYSRSVGSVLVLSYIKNC